MPFQSILTELVEAEDHALAALFVDDSGELIGLACADGDRERMELVAAYLPLYLQRARDALTEADLGRPRLFYIQRRGLHLHVEALPEDYVLSLVTGPRAVAGASRRRLARAAHRIRQEVMHA